MASDHAQATHTGLEPALASMDVLALPGCKRQVIDLCGRPGRAA